MIVRMAKVEIVGPKKLLIEVLTQIRELGVLQIDSDLHGFGAGGESDSLHPVVMDEKSARERVILEDLRRQIDELITTLPPVPIRECYLDPLAAVDTIAAVVERHAAISRELLVRREALARELDDMRRTTRFLGAVETLIARMEPGGSLDFFGVTLQDSTYLDQLRQLVADLTAGRYEMATTEAEDGTIIALIGAGKESTDAIRNALSSARVPELPFPAPLAGLPFAERVQRLSARLAEDAAELVEVDRKREEFARRWSAVYRRMQDWLSARLAILKATAGVHATEMCFFIHGWVSAADRQRLAKLLNGRFGGEVVVEEKRLLEQDLEKVPVVLRNPPYVRPFELFTRLLPLPRYGSYDPTPFLAIFFPLFFGMMMGDAGHGLLLFLLSLWLKRRYRQRPNVVDAARILLVCSTYAIIFGVIYGEFFGAAGREFLHLRPLWLERESAIMPMLYFTISVGAAHVLFGLFLGLLAALRKKARQEALAKLAHILLIVALALLVTSVVVPSPWLLTKPILVVAAILIPFLVITGGLIAPLELLKNIGNIISYARIMAIGLCSVIIANIANNFAGITGDIVIGSLAALLLHIINLVLGVFAPTVHALRLHFVEFFSKFLEHGGKRFTPLSKDRKES